MPIFIGMGKKIPKTGICLLKKQFGMTTFVFFFFNDFYFFHYSWFTVFCAVTTVSNQHISSAQYCVKEIHIIFSPLCVNSPQNIFFPGIAVLWFQVSSNQNSCFSLLLSFLQVFWTYLLILYHQLEALCSKEVKSPMTP